MFEIIRQEVQEENLKIKLDDPRFTDGLFLVCWPEEQRYEFGKLKILKTLIKFKAWPSGKMLAFRRANMEPIDQSKAILVLDKQRRHIIAEGLNREAEIGRLLKVLRHENIEAGFVFELGNLVKQVAGIKEAV